MIVKLAGETYNCTKAVKQTSSAVLYLADGGKVEFAGVHDWGAFSVDGGSWSTSDPTPEEQLRADIDFLAAMTGVELV